MRSRPRDPAAGDGPQPREQFAGGKCFGQIIVGSHLQADNPVRLLAPRGQHQNGHIGAAANEPQHLKAVDARQHDIEDHGVERFGERTFRTGASLVLGHDLIAKRLQVFLDQGAQFPVIVNDEDAQCAAIGGFRLGIHTFLGMDI